MAERAPNQVEFRQDLAYETEDGARLVPIEDDTYISDKKLTVQRRPRENPYGRDVRHFDLRKRGGCERGEVLLRFEGLKKKRLQLYLCIAAMTDTAKREAMIARRNKIVAAIDRMKREHPDLTGLHPE